MKVIDLLNKIANDEEVPKEISYNEYYLHYDSEDKDYYCEEYGNLFEFLFSRTTDALNTEIKVLDEKKEVKPITKKDLETLGYACGEIKRCFEKGWNKSLNNEPLEDDDKDIPLIPDDELYSVFDSKEGINKNKRIDYNFKVLKEKINQVVKEFNEYRKENE